jgi:hypothetical protein
MTRVLALIPDLLFGSRVQGMLELSGHEVRLVSDAVAVRANSPRETVLIVDLTGDIDGPALFGELSSEGLLQGTRTLGFYAHVDPARRDLAMAAGFDLVVPRSRMAREASTLVARLADDRAV